MQRAVGEGDPPGRLHRAGDEKGPMKISAGFSSFLVAAGALIAGAP
jgi:hypothetical protein